MEGQVMWNYTFVQIFSLLICLNYFQRGLSERCLNCWIPCFSRPFNDWEINEMENLWLCLSGKRVIADEDRVRWVESKDDIFSVKSLYKALELDSTRCFPMKIIWNSSAQPKVSFFVWEAS